MLRADAPTFMPNITIPILINNQPGLYTGPILNNLPHGEGIFRSDIGNVYAGNFDHGVRQGFGKLTTSKSTYIGEWYQDMRHGYGKYTSDAVYWEGVWEFDNFRYGSALYPSGRQAWGSWESGKLHGYGGMVCRQWSYVGSWVDGMRSGFGSCVHADPRLGTYTGDWLDDRRHGYGESQDLYGHYIGGWDRGLYHGHGRLTTDSTLIAVWNRGHPFGEAVMIREGTCIHEENAKIGVKGIWRDGWEELTEICEHSHPEIWGMRAKMTESG